MHKRLLNRRIGTEGTLLSILMLLCVVLALATDSFLTFQNLFDLLNNQ